MHRKMTQKWRAFADIRFVVWCCINLRLQQLRYGAGFKLFVGTLSSVYVDTTMSCTTFDKKLANIHDRVKTKVMNDLRSFCEKCLGYSRAFLGAQLDLMTAAGEEYITFTVSYL